MPIKVDFSQAQEIEPVPEGLYVLILEKHEEKVSQGAKTAGVPMINVQLSVGEPEEYNNRKLFSNFLLAPEYLFNLKNFMKAIDPEHAERYDSDEMDLELEEFYGKPVKAQVVQVSYTKPGEEPRRINNIKKWLPL